MTLSARIARHFYNVHFGGNWTSSNLQENLRNVNWQQATRKIPSFNSIAVLVYHMNYYVATILKVLKGGPLDAHDKFSFELPPIQTEEDWQNLLDKTWREAREFTTLVESLPESTLWETFVEEKYGTYYANLHGVIEHTHYHLGQVVILKKLIAEVDIP